MRDSHALHCPQCHIDFSDTQKLLGEQKLSFCLECQFPLMLIAGKYRLEGIVAEGGHGVVYKARHIYLENDALRVVKILKPDVFKIPGMEQRFYREVQVTSALSQKDDHVVRIYDDFGKIPNVGPFYVMEHLGGRRFDLLLEASSLPSLSFVANIMRQLCETMQSAHDSNIVHRDLKPENLFVVKRREEKHFLKVLDFGIAKPINQKEFKITQGVLGTPFYMAPEQCLNDDVDARTDIYSMGCILFEALTGHPPFHPGHMNVSRDSLVGLLGAHISLPPPRPSQLQPARVSLGLEDIVLKAIAKQPDDRYQTAKELSDALAQEWLLIKEGKGNWEHPLFEATLDDPNPEAVISAEQLAGMAFSSATERLESPSTRTFVDSAISPEEKEFHSANRNAGGTVQDDIGSSGLLSIERPSLPVNTIQYERGVWHYRAMLVLVLLLSGGVGGGWWWLTQPSKDPGMTKIRPLFRNLEPHVRRASAPPKDQPRIFPRAIRRRFVLAKRVVPIFRKKRNKRQKRREYQRHRRKKSPRRGNTRPSAPNILPPRRMLTILVKKMRPKVPLLPRVRVIPPPTKHCPGGIAGARWVRLNIQPANIAIGVNVIKGNGRVIRRGTGFCLLLRTSIQILIEAPEHRACSFSLPFRHSTLPIRLRKEVIDDIEENRNYCLR